MVSVANTYKNAILVLDHEILLSKRRSTLPRLLMKMNSDSGKVMTNMEYKMMYDQTKEVVIAKLKVLSDIKRMMLLNKYAR